MSAPSSPRASPCKPLIESSSQIVKCEDKIGRECYREKTKEQAIKVYLGVPSLRERLLDLLKLKESPKGDMHPDRAAVFNAAKSNGAEIPPAFKSKIEYIFDTKEDIVNDLTTLGFTFAGNKLKLEVPKYVTSCDTERTLVSTFISYVNLLLTSIGGSRKTRSQRKQSRQARGGKKTRQSRQSRRSAAQSQAKQQRA